MQAIAIIPIVVMLAGLVTYALSNNSKVSSLALAAFACGLLVACMAFATHSLGLNFGR